MSGAGGGGELKAKESLFLAFFSASAGNNRDSLPENDSPGTNIRSDHSSERTET